MEGGNTTADKARWMQQCVNLWGLIDIRFCMRSKVAFLAFMLCSNLSFGQSDGSVVRISNKVVHLLNQESGFILGLNPITVLIDSAFYKKKIGKYIVYGTVDDVNHNGNDSMKVMMQLIRGTDTSLYGYTGLHGRFKVMISHTEKIKFSGGFQDKFLYIQK